MLAERLALYSDGTRGHCLLVHYRAKTKRQEAILLVVSRAMYERCSLPEAVRLVRAACRRDMAQRRVDARTSRAKAATTGRELYARMAERCEESLKDSQRLSALIRRLQREFESWRGQ